jgi:HK97 gp10 family phage protein
MARAHIVLTGSEELNRKLAELSGPKAKMAIRKASRVALRPVAEQAKSNAPRKSGRLGRSIKVKAIRRSRSRVGARVTSSGTDHQFKGRTFYGGFQEYGWKSGRRTRNADFGVSRRKRRTAAQSAAATARDSARRQVPGKQFMKRAARSKRQVALGIYRSETRRWIRELSK